MSRPKRIIHKKVAEVGQRPRKARIVLLFSAEEAGVLENEDLSFLDSATGLDRFVGIRRLDEGEVAFANVHSGRRDVIGDVALFTFATPRQPNDSIADELRASGMAVTIIGDAYAPRTLLMATAEGYRAGMEI